VFREEIDTALNPGLLRVVATSELVPLEHLVQQVQRDYPRSPIFSIRMPREPGEVYELRLNSNAGRRFYVDPHTGRVLGSREACERFMDLVFCLHSEWLAGEAGKSVVGGSALVLMVLVATGLMLWCGSMRSGRRFAVRADRGHRVLLYDLHKLVGVLAAPLLVVVAFTGLSLVFHPTFERILNEITQTPSRVPLPISSDRTSSLKPSVDQMLERAERAMPDAVTTWILFPQTPDAPLRVRKKLPQELHPNGKTFVMLDQYSGRVLRVDNALTAPVAQRFDNILYPIHIGRWSGKGSELFQVVTGPALALLFVTGAALWNKRRRTVKRDTLPA
jgi:uncharacterized iron-regulated membrane protein